MKNFISLLVVYILVSLMILFSAEISKIGFLPVNISFILLIIVYIWYRDYAKDRELLSKVPEVSIKDTWILILGLFLLSMIVRAPSVLLYGEPYEKIVVIYLTVLAAVLILGCKLSVFGFKSERFGRALMIGVVYYFIFEFSARIIQFALFFFSTGRTYLVGYDPLPFLLSFPFMTFCVGISEEGLFRGFMQTLLQKFYSVRVSILVQSILFGLWHFIWHVYPFNPFGMIMHILYSFIIGVLFGYFYSIAENLTPLILVHGLIDSFPQGYKFASLAGEYALNWLMIEFLSYILSIILMFMLTRKLAEWMKKP